MKPRILSAGGRIHAETDAATGCVNPTAGETFASAPPGWLREFQAAPACGLPRAQTGSRGLPGGCLGRGGQAA